jgi:hypothetical protein
LAARFFAEERAARHQLLIVDDRSRTAPASLPPQRRFDGLHLVERDGRADSGAPTSWAALGSENGHDVVGTMDADLSHDPKTPAMLAARKTPTW